MLDGERHRGDRIPASVAAVGLAGFQGLAEPFSRANELLEEMGAEPDRLAPARPHGEIDVLVAFYSLALFAQVLAWASVRAVNRARPCRP